VTKPRLALLVCLAGLAVAASPAINTDRARIITARVAQLQRGTLRVATWNIDRGTELRVITSELNRNPVDLLLLQEVDWNAKRSGNVDEATELARRLHMHGAYATEFEELSQEQTDHPAFIGQATLTRLPLRSARILRFAHQSGFWKPRSWLPSSVPLMQRRLGSRVALVTELSFEGKTLVVYNAHLESRSYGRIQMQQIEEMLADASRYPENTPVILGGDLNTKYLPSTFLNKLERAGYRSALGEKIERTHTIAMALDWIFAKGPVELSGGVVRKDVKGSDHYPVYAELRMKRREPATTQ
jgi:endonuclease/exonuclease/phosphatase family metal-dependent hydrolase